MINSSGIGWLPLTRSTGTSLMFANRRKDEVQGTWWRMSRLGWGYLWKCSVDCFYFLSELGIKLSADSENREGSDEGLKRKIE